LVSLFNIAYYSIYFRKYDLIIIIIIIIIIIKLSKFLSPETQSH
jgi:hypothetical protein